MPRETNLQTLSAIAHADLSLKQFYAVTFKSTNDIDVSTAGSACSGILQNNPASGVVGSYAYSGVTLAALAASQNIAIGDLLEVGSGGTLIAHASGTVVAQAMEASNVASIQYITVRLLPSNAAV